VVRVGGRQHALVAAGRLPGSRADANAVAAGLARATPISARTAIGGVVANVGANAAADLESWPARRRQVRRDVPRSVGADVRPPAVAAAAGADRHRCVLTGNAVRTGLQLRPAAADDGHEPDPEQRRKQAPGHAFIYSR